MNIYVIYKQTMNMQGEVIKVELIECDSNDVNTQRFTKLYNLQIPHDLRNTVSYSYLTAQVLD